MLKFSRAARLVHRKDFQSVLANNPLKISSRYIIAFYRPNQVERPRLGLLIKKYIIKRAVDRNRIKRIMRESFREHQRQLGNFDIVLLLRKTASDFHHLSLRQEVNYIWQKLVAFSAP